MLPNRIEGKACLADMDIQFGVAGLYLDLPEAVTMADLLGIGAKLGDTEFTSVLTEHRSGARVLAAPRELMPLETVGAQQIDSLVRGLRRDFGLTLIDLPAVWTAWTNRILSLADRIVLVTQLSVPHIHLVKRQIQMLATQRLDGVPLILVCNAVSQDQLASLPIKSAEKALGRSFDVVVPEDRRVMTAAVNQGLGIAAVRRGTKLEKAIGELADKVAARASVQPIVRKRW
jgi:pilus assembly protein CpaE